MSTQVPHYQEETQRFGPPQGQSGQWQPQTGGRRHGKPFFLTSEFFVLLGVILALVIAAAVSDSFDAPRMWTLVTVLGGAYILSRGLSKAGVPRD